MDWNYRKQHWNFRQPSCALDVTRTKIPRPWSKKDQFAYKRMKHYWSAKDKYHALKYEVIVSLGKYCKIVYVSGSWAGSIHDINIARNSSLLKLEDGEKVVADMGYIGQDNQIITPLPRTSFLNSLHNRIMGYLRQNVERMNKRIKNI